MFLQSDILDKINEPQFLISLKTEASSLLSYLRTILTLPTAQSVGGAVGSSEFVCTLAGLQDLISKLKDASKSLDRFASI